MLPGSCSAATACWKQASWTAGWARAPRGKWPIAAEDPPGGEPGWLGADGAGRDWVQGGFHHAGFAAVQWGWLKAEDVEYVGAGWH